jgi:S-adenosylmethionine/arginine decarboxylase-like enzyme
MPGMEAASSYTDLRRQEAVSAKRLYAIDALCTPDSPVSEVGQLIDIAVAAVAAGGGHVLDASHVVFPNGAITLVLILAESHLSIHTCESSMSWSAVCGWSRPASLRSTGA